MGKGAFLRSVLASALFSFSLLPISAACRRLQPTDRTATGTIVAVQRLPKKAAQGEVAAMPSRCPRVEAKHSRMPKHMLGSAKQHPAPPPGHDQEQDSYLVLPTGRTKLPHFVVASINVLREVCITKCHSVVSQKP
ncbi:hypothetical protein BD289DRAFT_457033 [Coniella lustricola]|uniref:Secreted protein n=1 Tax=Coniella lustricola TaxID=2025994 RepID=A0A2T2ZTI7_9PEZI|nr:hypothetical protein BD289DRAFT_457033 [Coniella lustricola]